MRDTDRPVVLIVDDEPQLSDLFATWLSEDWSVRTATDGESALEQMDDDVDIALLDRRMPGLSGDEVLDAIRVGGYDCRVVMITAVDPDFDIIEMGFDDYIVKPVSRTELLHTVERTYGRSKYDDHVRTYFSLLSKRAVLESEKSDAELAENDAFGELIERIEDVKERADASLSEMNGHDDFASLFERVPSEGSVRFED